MAQMPLRPCRHAGCSELTRDGWCPKHKPPSRQRGASAAYHSWYNKPIWNKRLRPQQLIREPFCRECAAQGVRTHATVADHIKPFRGDWNLFTSTDNFQSLCEYHHNQKTAREQAQFRREMR